MIDVAFDGAALPLIEESLSIIADEGPPIIAEVQAHLDECTVRALALQSTAGLRRGVPVQASGGPIQVPVGEAMLGRLIDVTGTPATAALRFLPTCRAARFIARRPLSPYRAVPPRSFRLASRSSIC